MEFLEFADAKRPKILFFEGEKPKIEYGALSSVLSIESIYRCSLLDISAFKAEP